MALDDRVCPACDVLLPEGTSTCVKCGRTVELAPTGILLIDGMRAVHPRLVEMFGRFWGNVFAVPVAVFLAFMSVAVHLLAIFR